MATDPSEVPWRPGDVIAGKYVVDSVIGDGGMGTVLKALHRELDEFVAIKMLKSAWLAEAAVLARFNREARAVVKLKGEHVARVIDVGRTDQGVPFMVMEYLEGRDLGEVMTHGPAELQSAVDWIIEACDALGEAHTHRIIHRDIKPENLFLVQRHGRASVKLLDFGISKIVLGDEGDKLHETTRMLGTPLYMSPEQVRASASIDHRSDIWALGAVLYELLSGSPPFMAETLPEVCAMILEDVPRALTAVRAGVPRELEDAVFRCLAKRPEDRFQSVADLAIALLPLAHPRQHATVEHLTRVMRLAGIPAPQLSSVPPPAGDRLSVTGEQLRVAGTTPGGFHRNATTMAMPTPSRRRRWLLPLLLLSLAGAAVGTALALGRASNSPTLPAADLGAAEPFTAPPTAKESAPKNKATTASAPASASVSLPVASAEPELPPTDAAVRKRAARVASPAVERPKPKPEPAPQTSTPPTKPKLEIRMER